MDPRFLERKRSATLGRARAPYEEISSQTGGSILPAGIVVPLALSLIRCTSMAVQAFSASASVLKGEPPTLMAHLF